MCPNFGKIYPVFKSCPIHAVQPNLLLEMLTNLSDWLPPISEVCLSGGGGVLMSLLWTAPPLDGTTSFPRQQHRPWTSSPLLDSTTPSGQQAHGTHPTRLLFSLLMLTKYLCYPRSSALCIPTFRVHAVVLDASHPGST